MTGFRIAKGCAQEHFGVTPDICTMGKVIGGGLPVGAFGGKKEIMETVAPAGPMYQSGTLSGNPLAMASGIKTLEILDRPGSYEHLEKVTSRLVQGILDAGKEFNIPVVGGSISGAPLSLCGREHSYMRAAARPSMHPATCRPCIRCVMTAQLCSSGPITLIHVVLCAGMFGFFFSEHPVTCFEDAAKYADAERFGKYHRMMLERGVYLAPSMYEAGFTSLAHTEEHIDKTLEAVRDAFSKL